jgi:DNA-binding NarL/FixJ family response regulator
MIRILVADDQNLIRQTLTHMFDKEDDFQVVGEANNGIQALTKAEQLRPDIIIMDVDMPKMNGLDATKAIVRLFPDIKVIVISGNDADGLMALESGAKGYLLKDSTTKLQLAESIRRIYWQLTRNSFEVISQLKRQSADKETEPLDEINLSTFDSRNLEIINAEFQTIDRESAVATAKQEECPSKVEENINFSLDRDFDLEDLDELEPNNYCKLNLEEAIALFKQHIEEFKTENQKKGNKLDRTIETLQQHSKIDPNFNLYLEKQLVRVERAVSQAQKQTRLLINLAIITIALIVFSLVFLITYAIVWS